MKRIGESETFEKINVSTYDIDEYSEQSIAINFTNLDKIDLIMVAGDQRLVEIKDVALDAARDVKIVVEKHYVTINIPIYEGLDYDVGHDDISHKHDKED